MKKIIIILLLLLSIYTQAQKGSITGSLFEKQHHERIPYGSILLKNMATQQQISGFADSKGEFNIEKLEVGEYELVVSYVGFEKHNQKEIKIENKNSKVNLGEIILVNASVTLQGVEVTANQKTMTSKIDRQVFRASDFETAKGGTAADILSKLPSIAIDPDGTISVRGSSDFMVYLNGKPTQMDASTLLSQVAANQIENVEIISVPTSKFDAQGKGGIVNITTKRTGDQGLSITANGLIGGSPWGNKTDASSKYKMNDNRTNAGVNFVYLKDKLSLYGGLNYSNREVNGNRDGDARILVDGAKGIYKHMVAAGERPETYQYQSASLGMDYQLSKSSTLSATYFMGKRKDARSAFYIYNNFYGDINKNPITGVDAKNQTLYNPNTDSRDGIFNTASVDFSHKFENKSDLKFSFQYEFSDFSRELSNANYDYDNTTKVIGARQLEYKQTDDTPLKGARLSVDYSKALDNGNKLGFGFQPQYFKISGAFNFDTLSTAGTLLPFTALENAVNLERGIYASYLDYTGNLSNINFIAGIRAEYTDQNIDINSLDYFSILTTTADKKPNYTYRKLDLFPSFMASYKPVADSKISFAASRRINRPALKSMTPFLYRRHLEVYEVGDPTLKPEYLNNVELTLEKTMGKQNISLVGFYRGVENAVFRVNTVTNEIPSVMNIVKEEVLIRSFTNAGNSTSTGLELNANLDLNTKLKMYLGGSVFNYSVKGDIFGYLVNNSSVNWSIKSNLNYFISKELKFTADFNFRSATVTAQGQNDLFYLANVAISYSPKKWNGWEFSFKGLDLLHSNVEGLDTKAFNNKGAEIFYQETTYYRYGPIAELGITHSFNSKAKAKKAAEGVIGKEQF